MAKEPPAQPDERSAPEKTLKSALAYYADRENYDLIEGIVRPDRNNPPEKDSPGNVIIVVSGDEFYSVSEADILPPEEEARAERPQRVWVKRGAQVWHCQQTPLNVEGQRLVKTSELPVHIDNHFFANYSGLALPARHYKPTVPRSKEDAEKNLLAIWRLPTSVLKKKFDAIRPPVFDEDPETALFRYWHDDTFLYARPPRDCYYKWFDRKGVTTLEEFVEAFREGITCLP